jgi:hypothetical protein
MITRFQATGAKAGTPKIRCALRMPVTVGVSIAHAIRFSQSSRWIHDMG